MSRPRIAAGFAAVLSAALLAVRAAMWFFPTQAPAQKIVGAEDPLITVDAGAPLVYRTAIARGSTTEAGTVVVEVKLNSNGEVTDAHAVSGPGELTRSVLASVLEWRYAMKPAPRAPVQIRVTFDAKLPPHGDPAVQWPPPEIESRAVLTNIQFVGVSAHLEQEVRARLPVREGDQISSKSRERILAAAREVDERFSARMNFGPNDDATLIFSLGARMSPSSGRQASGAPQRIRVRGDIQAASLAQRITPVYPPLAKAARIQGAVKLRATINREGKVTKLELISGHPLLVGAAIQAVRQWEYRPTLLNGNPVEVITEIDIHFTPSQ